MHHRTSVFILAFTILNGSIYAVAAPSPASASNAEISRGPAPASASEASHPSDTEERDMVYNVSFPANTAAFLDPGNLSGRGQIFSGKYSVENYGSADAAVKIKNIHIICQSEGDTYEFMEEEIDDSDSMVKRLSINMIWVNESEGVEETLHVVEGAEEECVLFLKAAEYDDDDEFTGLNEGSTGYFYFTGTLNANPELVWEDDEISVQFDYEIVTEMDEEEEEELEEEVEGEEEELPEKAEETEKTQPGTEDKTDDKPEGEEQKVPENIPQQPDNEMTQDKPDPPLDHSETAESGGDKEKPDISGEETGEPENPGILEEYPETPEIGTDQENTEPAEGTQEPDDKKAEEEKLPEETPSEGKEEETPKQEIPEGTIPKHSEEGEEQEKPETPEEDFKQPEDESAQEKPEDFEDVPDFSEGAIEETGGGAVQTKPELPDSSQGKLDSGTEEEKKDSSEGISEKEERTEQEKTETEKGNSEKKPDTGMTESAGGIYSLEGNRMRNKNSISSSKKKMRGI